MEPATVWGKRWTFCEQPIAKRYMKIACKKQSLVVLAADKNTMLELKELLEDYLCQTNSLKAKEILHDWSNWIKKFKVIIPPSEKKRLGVEGKEITIA